MGLGGLLLLCMVLVGDFDFDEVLGLLFDLFDVD